MIATDRRDYAAFLASKRRMFGAHGVGVALVHESLFPFQAKLTRWALRKGRACIFAATGLGKTRMQIEWAHACSVHTSRPTIVVAPLAVAQQTVREAASMGRHATYARHGVGHAHGLVVTNYEMLGQFDPDSFGAIVLDESSILKSHDGETRKRIMDFAARIPLRLACTATPAPNDHMELGTHAEFVGACTRAEMLAEYFVHDGGDTSKWRLKNHAVAPFWDWVCGWAACVSKPSDLGDSDDGFDLPPLNVCEHVVRGVYEPVGESLFEFGDLSATGLHAHKRKTTDARADKVADLVRESGAPFLVWCDTNYEADALKSRLPDAMDLRGSLPHDEKERMLLRFSSEPSVLISKPRIAGFGMNWQHCNQMAFIGLSFSWEQTHQAIRRCYRFGQKSPVSVHVVTADTESSIASTIKLKESRYETMTTMMRAAMRRRAEDFS